MDDVKTHLKEARDYIEKCDFEEAIKSIKKVLKKDKSNYMALVLLGVALQDSEQVPLAYRKAIAVNKDKPLAWQGLASYYERNNLINKDLIQTYISMCQLENDTQKYNNICSKLLDACKKSENIEYCSLIYEHALTQEAAEKKITCCNILNDIILSLTLNPDSETVSIIENIFTLNCNNSIHSDDFNVKFFENMITSEGFEKVISKYNLYILSHMTSKLTEVILKCYVKEYIKQNAFCSEAKEENNVLTNILEKFQGSFYCSLVQGLLMFNRCEYYEAYCMIKSIHTNPNNDTMLRIVIGNICLKLKRWLEAESVSFVTHNDPIMHRRLLKIHLVALCSQNDDAKCENGLKLKHNIETNMDQDEIKAVCLASLRLKDYESVNKYIMLLEKDPEYICLKYLFIKQQTPSEVVDFLEKNVESYPYCWLHLATLYMDQKEYDKALMPLLKAAKVDKHNYLIFVYLGDYYSVYNNNLEKAKKCYSKAFSLNPECCKAGKCLSNVYRNLKNWDANYNFLKQLSFHQNNKNSWTWLELGLHHFALEQWDEAIVSLRSYVRLESNDAEAWESLADAYYSRGSYTSALKCYEKSIELDHNRIYSLVQVGGVHCLLGNYTEALSAYYSIDDDTYLPALKGLGDVHLVIANEKLSMNLYESCRNHAQKSIDYTTKALLHGHQYASMWTDLSKAISVIAALPTSHRWLYIHPKFWNNSEDNSEILLADESLFILSIQCLCKAISYTQQTNLSLCFKLAAMNLDYYRLYGNVEAAQRAYVIIKNCIKMKRDNWQYWNLLGVICMSKDIKKYLLAQHAFLKALQLEFNNAMVWSNLGVIYIFFGHVLLANKAFQKAQQFDPLYMQSWIGQALIAESIDHSDAMGLFLHSAQLGFHKESSIGYAECVCKNLFSKQRKLEYSMKNMHAVPIACDLMTWLCQYQNKNPYCLNILGILQEKMGLLKSSVTTYEKALLFIEEEYKDTLLFNYGRALYLNGNYNSAMDVFKSMKEENMASYCGLTLCLNKLGKYQDAYNLYGTAFQWLCNDILEKGQLLVALASAAYKSNDIEDCKTLIYQSIDEGSSYVCIPVILAACAFSIVISDKSLYAVALKNLNKLNVKHKYSDYMTLFESYNLLKYENTLIAIKKLQQYIHITPNHVHLWQLMAKYSCLNLSHPATASISTQKVIALGVPPAELLANYKMVSISETYLGNYSKALKFAQKAIHLHPNRADCWLLLLYAYQVGEQSIKHLNVVWVKLVIQFVKKYLSMNSEVQHWFQTLEQYS